MTEGRKPPLNLYPPQGQNDEISRAEQILAAKTRAEKDETMAMISLEHTLDSHKQEKVKQARILTGQVKTDGNGEVLPVDSASERSKAIAVQSTAAALGAVLNLVWITYAGTDAPAELYAAIPVLVQLMAQAGATFINNRKA